MADYVATTEDLKTVADSIRAKGGTSAPLAFPDGFATAVGAIDTAKPEQAKTVSTAKNGPVVVTPDNGKALSSATVNVNVPSDKKPETAGSEIIKANGKKTFSPPSGGVFSSFTADVQVPIPPAPVTQEKTVSITENGDVTITPDAGKLLSKVIAQVNVAGGGGGSDLGPFTAVKIRTFTPGSNDLSAVLESDELVANYIACLKSKSGYQEYEVQNFLIRFLHTGGVDETDEAFRAISAYEKTKKGILMYPGYTVYSNGRINLKSETSDKPSPKFMAGETYYLIFLW